MRSTCIRFVERTDEKDYIRIFPGQGFFSRCYSHVGRTGGQQPVSIGQGCNWLGTIIHELGHALGFYHEQNRSDRDEYLIIYWDNIKEGLEDQFFLLKPEQNLLLTDFDYDSIMLYGEYTFSKEKGILKTMAAKKGNKRLLEVTQKGQLSKTDIVRISMLYKCNKKSNKL
ncbi:astacin-like metalloprotease toxin 4 isoform X1 [Stegodyphus dumicola]|uniref:astacin-like metalloprotease toxin 4 isoform X1 n=1 Tax=Stegodyphus dumicola TaxID=202533 RepID=UPI0015A98F75|nr:astacin-like metalloprotease toxin 4 isoform X1 [Stegodyphus dumicola]